MLRVLWPSLKIDGDSIVMNDSARFALAHLLAALPDHVITALPASARTSRSGVARPHAKAMGAAASEPVGRSVTMSDVEFVRRMLKRAVKDAGGQKHFTGTDCRRPTLRRNARPARAWDGICSALGLRRVVSYVYDHERAGALETSEGER